MDEYRENVKKVQKALNQDAAFIQSNPYLAQRVLNAANAKSYGKGGLGVRKKFSLSLVLVLVVMMLTVTAVAAVLLSMRQIVDEHAIPMANEYSGESYTIEDTNILLQLAEENGIVFSEEGRDSIARFLSDGEGYPKEEMLMLLAKAEFGEQPERWTIEQQKWFDDACVAIGFIDSNEKDVPSGDDISEEDAYRLAAQYIYENCGNTFSVDDETQFHRGAQYIINDGAYTCPKYWRIEFAGVGLKDPTYCVFLSDTGEFLDVEISLGIHEKSTYSDVINRYRELYGWNPASWSQEILRAFRHDIDMCIPSNDKAYLCLKKVQYPDLDDDKLNQQQAVDIGAKHLGLREYMVDTAVYVTTQQRKVWRICFYVDLPDDSFQYYYADIDAMDGTVLYAHMVDGRTYLYYDIVPQSVIEEVDQEWEDNSPAFG